MLLEALYEISVLELELGKLAPKRLWGLQGILLPEGCSYHSHDPQVKQRWAESEQGKHYIDCLRAAIEDVVQLQDAACVSIESEDGPRMRLSGLAERLVLVAA